MATQMAGPEAAADPNTIVDVRGGRTNGTRQSRGTPRTASTTSGGGRPQWVSILLALAAGALALLGGFMLLRSDTEEAAPVPAVTVLYAETDLPAGTSVDAVIDGSATLLSPRSVPVEFALPGSVTTIGELEPLRGQTLTSPIYAGNPIAIARFSPITDFGGESFIDRQSNIAAPAGHMKLALRLPPSRALGGSIAAGDTVAVLASFKPAGDVVPITTLLLPAVEVIDVKGRRSTAPEDQEDILDPDAAIDDIAVTEFDITVAVTPEESTRLAFAIESGSIILAGSVEGAAYDDPRFADTLTTILGRTSTGEIVEQIELDPLPFFEAPIVEETADEAQAAQGVTNIAPSDQSAGDGE